LAPSALTSLGLCDGTNNPSDAVDDAPPLTDRPMPTSAAPTIATADPTGSTRRQALFARAKIDCICRGPISPLAEVDETENIGIARRRIDQHSPNGATGPGRGGG
jgi:hypothetical protein